MHLLVNIKKKLNNFTLDISFETTNDLAILGMSGVGKTMILKCIAGIEKPDSGMIIFNNKVLFDSKKNINISIQERNIGYLFQNYALFPHLSVLENIEIANKNQIDINNILQLFAIEDIIDKYPKQISGGQQQRVALARLLVSNPDLILLDEPFSNLDILIKKDIKKYLDIYLKKSKKNIVLVSHDFIEAFSYTKNTIIIENGIMLNEVCKNHILYANPQKLVIAKLFNLNNYSTITNINNYIYADEWNIQTTIPFQDYKYIAFYDYNLEFTNNSQDILINDISINDNIVNKDISISLINSTKKINITSTTYNQQKYFRINEFILLR